MKIPISLNSKSLQEAIKILEELKSKIPQMKEELLQRTCLAIMQRANENLSNSDLNYGFINEIRSGWKPVERQNDGTYLIRNYGRAYSAEFGIGIVGEGSYKGDVPSAYEYNMETRYKNSDGSWAFRVTNINTLDITDENVMERVYTGEKVYEEGRTIMTQGQKAVMFLFNAVMDFIQKKEAQQIWQDIKERHIK